ncbi:VOC family protein [Sphingobacterium daejeonense]|uniref:VOC family protein n=1 Tax=Sphingobacterium daejeonense TaxID=371142 RepID=A0ABW3RMK8_9SPHI
MGETKPIMMSETNSNSPIHEQIQYIEFLSEDLQRAKHFYTTCFGWTFTVHGQAGFHTDGVFRLGTPLNGTILIVLYSQDLEATMGKIVGEGGAISKGIFNFPGGRRFHFRDLDGYELAVWSE